MSPPHGPLTSRVLIFGELFRFLWQRKEWWLFPIITAIVVLGLLVSFANSSALSPFLYSLF